MALAATFMLGCAFTSCSKDDDKNGPEENGGDSTEQVTDPVKALVGSWYASFGKDGDFTYKFNANGKGQVINENDYNGYSVENITWKATSSYLTVQYEDWIEEGYYSLSADGNTLTWDGDKFTRL